MDNRKGEDDTFLRKKNRAKAKQCYHNDICWWKRASFSNEVEITRGIVWKKIYKKKKLKSIWMLWVLTCFYRSNSCAKHNDSASVFLAKVMWTCKDDVSWASRENWKELSSSAISRETLFNGDSNEETLNLNNTCWQY